MIMIVIDEDDAVQSSAGDREGERKKDEDGGEYSSSYSFMNIILHDIISLPDFTH